MHLLICYIFFKGVKLKVKVVACNFVPLDIQGKPTSLKLLKFQIAKNLQGYESNTCFILHEG